jgi:chemotaxis protein methyltransferase CheR
MGAGGCDSIGALADRLADDAALRLRLRRGIANSRTGAFRDPDQFRLLHDELLPPMLAAGGPVRVWSAGCSDGSELFSLAELFERLGAAGRAHLLGSDLLEENLAKARARAAEAPASVSRALRWERRDLVNDGAPPGRWQLVLCRNVAIYFNDEARDRLHGTLAAALAPGGVLLLGRSERLPRPDRLELVEVGPHAYRRRS